MLLLALALLLVAALAITAAPTASARPAPTEVVELEPITDTTQTETVTLESGSTVTFEYKPQTGNTTNLGVSVGWTSAVVRLNQSDQRIALASNGGAIAAALCYTTVIGCIAAAGIAAGAVQWLSERGGICTGTRPNLHIHVRYFPASISYITCAR